MSTTLLARSAFAALATLTLAWPGSAALGVPIGGGWHAPTPSAGPTHGQYARPQMMHVHANTLPSQLLFIETEQGSINIYPLKNPSQSGPIAAINGLTAQQDQMTTDRSGNLYVVNNGAVANDFYISVYAPPYTSPPVILNTIWQSAYFFPQGIAVDGAGNVYVSDCGAYCLETPAVYYYPAGSTNPTQQITSQTFDSMAGLTSDVHGNLYALSWNHTTSGQDVYYIKAGSNAPKALKLHGLITGNGGNGLSLDGLGNLYVANNTSGSNYILEYKLGAHNAHRIIDSMPFTQGPEMIEVGADGNLYVPVGCSFVPCTSVYGFHAQGRNAFESIGPSQNSQFIAGVTTFPNLLLKKTESAPDAFGGSAR